MRKTTKTGGKSEAMYPTEWARKWANRVDWNCKLKRMGAKLRLSRNQKEISLVEWGQTYLFFGQK